ncbi:MAG: hypothetical protein A2X03_11595 [Bacteroidetes bacterium GWA2_40_15]|nr:MAG: hypothetical protein A2X03_11595 [Bacteroidetes bacterium GWA2_40_15]HBQ81803.1 hypothetical protein [Bacteroidales bacterium]
MKFRLGSVVFISILLMHDLYCQKEAYTVTLSPFSTDKYDEYAPVYYKNGIVFCTNRNSGLVLNYTDSDDKGFFRIYFVDTTYKSGKSDEKLFSKNLTTKLNDGPVTFNRNGDTIFYSRNINDNLKQKEVSGPRNKLGIFSAQLAGKEWVKIREFRLNNEWYNITTPCLSPDGRILYFASDKPGGYGGSDLYYCQFENGYWKDPVNMGKEINSTGNESYPFINLSGELFFSSDGLPGLGGKDIFFSRFSDTAWLTPVHISPPVNSPYDDFGLISDPLMSKGYFSSNRNNSLDIYNFKTNFPQIFYSSLQRENQYCFRFNDSGSIAVDTTYLKFRWSFGDGKSSDKAAVNHCYNGPGNYIVRLDIIDRKTGNLFFVKLLYSLDIKDVEQAYIKSHDVAVKGDVIEFDATKSFLPGFEVINQSWDFGDGKRASGGTAKHSYEKSGVYSVNLGLKLKSTSNGEFHQTGISKKILIVTDLQEKTDTMVKRASFKASVIDIKNYENAIIKTEYSAESEIKQDVVFTLELLESENKVDLKSSSLNRVPQKYVIKETEDLNNGFYSYCTGRQMNLMAAYPAYSEMLALGFKDVKIRTLVLKEPSEIELYNLIKNNGTSADTYFDSSDMLTSVAYIMLDQIVKLMTKYPSIKLEVSVNTDNTGSAENNLALTQKRSRVIVNYLVSRGVNAGRLVAKGFGGSKPVAPNFLLKERRLNQRIDFNII